MAENNNNPSPLDSMKTIELALPELSSEADDDEYLKAAKAILNADFIHLGTGAGFSADSGLKVYKDIASVDAYKKKKFNLPDVM